MAEHDMERIGAEKAARRSSTGPKPADQTKAGEAEDSKLRQGAQTPAADAILELQQTRGNAYVQRLLKSRKVQAKLTVNPPDDQYEREADRMAETVTKSALVQRQAEPEEEEEQVQGLLQRQATPEEEEEVQTKLQRQADEEEEEKVQTKLQRQAGEEEEEKVQTKAPPSQVPEVTEGLEEGINAARSGGQALPDSVRSSMEPALGHDFSQVRLHTDAEADGLSRQLGAKAFTTGQDVFFREGEYSPDSHDGRSLIGHELTHLVQQGAPPLSRKAVAAEAKPAAGARKRQKNEIRDHSQLAELGCCDQGTKMVNPGKAKNAFGGKTAKDPVSIDLSVPPQEKEDGSRGPANFVRGVLSASVIDSLEQLLRAASEQGAKVVCDDKPGPDGIARTYRDLEGQWTAFHHKSDANHQPGSMVAIPGTSNHGTGRAIDFSGGTDFAWLLQNAANYGWVNYPAENWHYDHVSTPNIIKSHKGKLKRMIAAGQARSHSGGVKKQISEEEKRAFGGHYEMAEALEWNEGRMYLPDIWLKVQEYVGLPVEHRTGTVDWRTVKAVMEWQKCQGLKGDGKVGSATLAAMGL